MTPEELMNRLARLGILQDLGGAITLRLFNYWHDPRVAPTPDDWIRLAKEFGKPGEDVVIMDAVTL